MKEASVSDVTTAQSAPPVKAQDLARAKRALIYTIFVGSGACGLIYETAWVRLFGLVFGSTVYSVTMVLAAFMAGLALGSWWLGRVADRHPRPMLLYGMLEAGIGIMGAASPWLIRALEPGYVWLYHALSLPLPALNAVKFGLSFVVVLIPTALMGGTFPVLNRFVIRRLEALGNSTAVLYGLNTLGAVTGTLLAAFWLIGRFGVTHAIYAAAAVNLAVAAVISVWGLCTRWEPAAVAPEAEPAAPGRDPFTPTERLAAFTFAMSGLAALGYEVIWTRTLVYTLGTSVYSFAIMLATFLLGIAVGPFLVARRVDRMPRPLLALGVVQALIGIASVGGLLALTAWLWKPADMYMLERDFLVKAARAGGAMLPSALLMGATFPIVARTVANQEGTIGSRLGRIYSLNTLFSIVGSLVTGLVLLRLVGAWHTMLMLASLNLLVAMVVLGRAEAGRALRRGAVLAVAVVLTGGWLALHGADPFRAAVVATEGQWGPNVFYTEDEYATTTLFKPADKPLHLSIDGVPMAKLTVDTQIMAHLPLAIIPRPRKALLICFGMGATWNAARAHPELTQIDAVELVPGVVEAYRRFSDEPESLQDPRARIHVTDGRNFLLLSRDKYDLISVDPPVPVYSAGAVLLAAEGFFTSCRRHLTRDGIMMNWVPEICTPQQRCLMMNTFRAVFPHATVWQSPDGHGLYMLGTQRPLREVWDTRRVLAQLSRPEVVANMARYREPGKRVTPQMVLDSFLLDERALARYCAGMAVMTDDRPYVEFPLQIGRFVGEVPDPWQFGTTLAQALRPAGK